MHGERLSTFAGQPDRPLIIGGCPRSGTTLLRTMLQAGLGLGALGALVAGGVAVGAGIGGFGWMIMRSAQLIINGNPRTVVGHVPGEMYGDQLIAVRRSHLKHTRWRIDERTGEPTLAIGFKRGLVTLTGEDARRQAGVLIVHANRRGGTRKEVQAAVERIQEVGDAEALVTAMATQRQPPPVWRKESAAKDLEPFGMNPERRLAFEMALHEEQERRALEGELKALEQAWRQAEEIAKIADDLLVPETAEEWLRKQREKQ